MGEISRRGADDLEGWLAFSAVRNTSWLRRLLHQLDYLVYLITISRRERKQLIPINLFFKRSNSILSVPLDLGSAGNS